MREISSCVRFGFVWYWYWILFHTFAFVDVRIDSCLYVQKKCEPVYEYCSYNMVMCACNACARPMDIRLYASTFRQHMCASVSHSLFFTHYYSASYFSLVLRLLLILMLMLRDTMFYLLQRSSDVLHYRISRQIFLFVLYFFSFRNFGRSNLQCTNR